MMQKHVAGGLIIILVFLVLCEFWLPGLVAHALVQEVKKSDLHPTTVEGRVFAFPAAKILLGQIDGAKLVLHRVTIDNCQASQLTVEMPHGSLNWQALVNGRILEAFKPAGLVRAQLILNEGNLNNYLDHQGLKGIRDPRLAINQQGVQLNGLVNIWGTLLPVQLRGHFQVQNGELSFTPSDLQVAGVVLPSSLAQKVLVQMHFNLTWQKLPFNMKVQSVDVEGGNLVLSGAS
jgi:hypothetical protein